MERTKARKARFMSHFLKFTGKIILVFVCAGGIGAALLGNGWGIPLGIVALVAVSWGGTKLGQQLRNQKLKRIAEPTVLKTKDGFSFRDLNHNGTLDIYEDSRQSVTDRVQDLLSKMTIEEKAGLMFSPQMDVVAAQEIALKGGANYGGDAVKQILCNKINTFAAMGSLPPREFAQWHNALQRAAQQTRLGIPVTICSDPRHVFVRQTNPFTTQKDEGVSSWPSSLGFGAAADEIMAEQYGKIVAKELRALGIHFALHPCADTATEPRWPRICETYGEDSELNGRLAAAYIHGMEGDVLGANSVACCIKHFPGGGPQKDGDDPHFAFGKEQIYPGEQFNYHLAPFRTVIERGVTAVMPYYGVPIGVDGVEAVGFNFNKAITHDLLRKEMGFQGIVHTDYSIIEGLKIFGISCIPGRAWGIEQLNANQRLMRALDASVDQIGGECCAKRLAKLVRKGLVAESRLDESCARILKVKFELGLFDNPFVNENLAEVICRSQKHTEAGENAMRRSLVLLKNENHILPLKPGIKVYVEGFTLQQAAPYAQVVSKPQEADCALVWLDVPSRADHRDPMMMMFQSGELTYTEKQKEHMKNLMKICPTIVALRLTRPAVIPELKHEATAILAEFNASPEIILQAVFGKFSPSGKLPFTLPASMEAVRRSKSDTPFDCDVVCWPFGFSLSYPKKETNEALP